ncbi:MAG: hypothetical protein HYV77_01870 [Candidatus Wildermuthbacteria bacterium]|nr:hypothetical protein [Candidatus Wildermuthbacteria bacterium]
MRYLLAILALMVMVLAGCGNGENFMVWETGVAGIPAADDIFSRLNAPAELNADERSVWAQAVMVGYLDVSRLAQTGVDISAFEKPKNKESLKEVIARFPGTEEHRIALAFWAVKEVSPQEEIIYAIGVRRSELRDGGKISLYRRLLGENSRVLEYFRAEDDFMAVVFVKWNDPTATDDFQMGVSLEGVQQLAQALSMQPTPFPGSAQRS